MITHRELLRLLPGLALLPTRPALAQCRDRTTRVALLDEAQESTRAPQWAVFRKRLQESGYTDGKNFLIEPRWARGEPERLPALAAELVSLKPDVIVTSTTSAALAAVYGRRDYVDAGGLRSYGTDIGALFSRAAEYVHRVLQGSKPSDLPIEQASTFNLVLNLRAAMALRLKIPQSIPLRADGVIQ